MNFKLLTISRITSGLVTVLLLFSVFSCKDEQIDPTKDPLEGTIGGNEWSFEAGSSRADNLSGYLNGMLLNQETTDACAIISTVRPHILIYFPPQIGNYTLSVDNVEVIFVHEGGSVRYSVPAGFIHIVQITSTEVIGFLSADLDENNKVEGSFLLRICY